MSDADWQKMAKHMSRVSDALLFIDDSPNLTMMEIRGVVAGSNSATTFV